MSGSKILPLTIAALLLFTASCGDDSGGTNNLNNENQNNNDGIDCGNAILEGLEECDEGEDNSDTVVDACRSNCTFAHCGDGVVDTGEICDEGLRNSDEAPNTCRTDCREPSCGDGITDTSFGEGCDCGTDPTNLPDGCTGINGDGLCRVECIVIYCGNGLLDTGEMCDDGNLVAGDGCSPACHSDETCGNGVVDLQLPAPQEPEECDDGNTTAGDGCSPNCRIETCGNGVVDPNEVCDDGDLLSGDGCSADCQSDETCGNGYPDFAAGEQCDDANALSHDGCASGCVGELPAWQQWAPSFGTRGSFGSAFDTSRQELVVFGGNGSCGGFCNDFWSYNGNRWQRIVTSTTPPGRSAPFMAYDSARQRIVLFGGMQPTPSNDTWEFDGTEWSQVTTAATPLARSAGAMVFDVASGRMVLFGGTDGASPLGDTWEYDGTNWVQISTTNAPPARERTAMVYDPDRDLVVLYGGEDDTSNLTDTWEYDGTNWTQIFPATSPGELSGHRMTYDATRHVVVAVCGHSDTCVASMCDRTWEYDGTIWTLRSDLTTRPSPRELVGLDYDSVRGKVVLFGGMQGGAVPLGDVWEYDGTGWTETTPPEKPSARWGTSLAYDPSRRVAVMFGGRATLGGALQDDTWYFNGSSWEKSPLIAAPPPRSMHAMVWEDASDRLLLFGGYTQGGSGGPQNDTWVHDGTGWTELSPTNSPSARGVFGMAYDAGRAVIVLFGGTDDENLTGTVYGDTWEFDGTNWTQISPATSPPARMYTSMTYDASNEQIVMFGGIDSAIGMLQDTWTYDGVDWVQVHPPVSPANRGIGGMTYNERRQRVVLFGGSDFAVNFRDVWEFDGARWFEVFSNPPSGRMGPAMTYDSILHRVVLFGGAAGGVLGDTWTHRYASQWPDEQCANGIDDDDDGEIDCLDPDCEGQVCAPGQYCSAAVCTTP